MTLTFTDKVSKPSSEQMFWVKLYPKYYIDPGTSPWSVHSGSVFKTFVGDLIVDDTCGLYEGYPSLEFPIQSPTLLSGVDSVAEVVSLGDWFYNPDDGYLYLKAASGTPNDNGYTLESIITTASHAGHMYLTPGNSGTQEVYWEGNLVQPPAIKQSLSDLGVGFLPTISSSLRCSNTDHSFDRFLYSYDFKNAKCFVYQDFKIAGELLAPIQTVAGVIESFTVDDKEIDFSISTFYNVLESTYDLKRAYLYGFTTSIKPDHEKHYVRKIYGRVSGFKPLQTNYVQAATTGNNRSHIVSKDPVSAHPVLVTTINIAGPNTGITTTVTSAAGFAIGDSVVIEQSGSPTYSIFITDVNYTTNLLTHTNIPGRVVASGDEVRRGFVSSVKVMDSDGIGWFLSYERDWTEVDFNGCASLQIANDFESFHAGFPTPFNPDNMEISCNVYGVKALPSLVGGGSLGAVANEGGALCNPVAICYDILSDAFRGDETFRLFLDNASFIAETAAAEELIGFAIPEDQASEASSYKDILISILNSFLGRVSLLTTSSGPKFGINRVAPTKTTPDFIIDSNEIRDASYSHDYNDAPSRISIIVEKAEANHGASPGVVITGGTLEKETSTRFFDRNGKFAIRSYFTAGFKDVSTYLWHPNNYTTGAIAKAINHIMFYLWQRRGQLTVTVKNRLIEAEIGDTIQVNRYSLPGFEFIFGTEQTRKFILLEKQQGVDSVVLVLDDQKGVEDAAGSW